MSDNTLEMAEEMEEMPAMDAEESLLYSARHGEALVVRAMIEARREGKLTLNINCKGKSKGNLGWTPLQLATYFGHVEVVRVLLEAGADVDEVNDMGDTALHKACFIGNEDLVILLLNHNADVYIMNGLGATPKAVCAGPGVLRLVEGAEKAERVRAEGELLAAARENDLETVNKLLTSSNPPSINCTDSQGNTALHVAAYRGHTQLAVLLLQNGVNNELRNNSGQLASDLARDAETREVISVRPAQRPRRAVRQEGPLLRRSRFLGWRPVWAVLQRGVLLQYNSRAESARAERWRAKHYLDGATLSAPDSEPTLLQLRLSDGDVQRLRVPPPTDRQAWITALNEHISYSGHYLWAGAASGGQGTPGDTEDDCKPLGSMQDALTAATNSLALLDTQLRECAAIVAALDRSSVSNSLHQSACMRFQHVSGTGAAALEALRHCAALVTQAAEAGRARLDREIERNRVLEEALAALAKTHHALEMSVAEELTKSKRKKSSSNVHSESKENFYDVYDDDSDDDTLVSAGLGSPLGSAMGSGELPPADNFEDFRNQTPTNDGDRSSLSALSPASSLGTLVSTGGNVYRNALPYRLRRPTSSFSQWSI